MILNTSLEEFMQNTPGVTYIIDQNYEITEYTRRSWNEFAKDNNGPEMLKSDNIIGNSIFDFIKGVDVKEFYRTIYSKIFNQELNSYHIEAHCNSKEIVRDSIIMMTPIIKNGKVRAIVNQSVFYKKKPRPPQAYHERSQAQINPDLPYLTICSLCARVKTNDSWVSGSEYYRQGGTDEVNLTHGLCSKCHAQSLESIIEYNAGD